MVNKFIMWVNRTAFWFFFISGFFISFLKYQNGEFGFFGVIVFFPFYVILWSSIFTVIGNWIRERAKKK
jgi:hypothetical protein